MNVPREVHLAVPWITYRQLDFWVRKGYINADSPGSGYTRSFSHRELRVLKAMARLVQAGFPAQKAAELARSAITDVGSAGALRIKLGEGIILDIDALLWAGSITAMFTSTAGFLTATTGCSTYQGWMGISSRSCSVTAGITCRCRCPLSARRSLMAKSIRRRRRRRCLCNACLFGTTHPWQPRFRRRDAMSPPVVRP
jgi:MerR HTH family regulatory protein